MSALDVTIIAISERLVLVPGHVACLWMCVLFCFSSVCLYVCAYVLRLRSIAGVLSNRTVCVLDVIGALTVWRQNNHKKKSITPIRALCH